MGFSIISGQSCEYPLLPYRDTNIPWDLGRCFEGTILRGVPWVANVILASDVAPPPRIMPATQATHSILYLGQEFRGNKMASCDCLNFALCDQFAHQKTLHAHGK